MISKKLLVVSVLSLMIISGCSLTSKYSKEKIPSNDSKEEIDVSEFKPMPHNDYIKLPNGYIKLLGDDSEPLSPDHFIDFMGEIILVGDSDDSK